MTQQIVLQDLQSGFNPANYVLRNGTQGFTGNQSMGGHRLIDLADPVNAQDAATLHAVMALIAAALIGAGTGDVVGPASADDNALARFDGASGKLLQNSGWTLNDVGKMKGVAYYSPLVIAADGPTVTFNCNFGNDHQVTLGGNRTLAVSNVTLNQKLDIRLKQDATGSRTVTWFSNIFWPGGVAPTLSTAAGHVDTFAFVCIGTDSYGVPVFRGYITGLDFPG